MSFTRTARKVQRSNTAISDLTSGSSRLSPCGRLQLAAHVPHESHVSLNGLWGLGHVLRVEEPRVASPSGCLARSDATRLHPHVSSGVVGRNEVVDERAVVGMAQKTANRAILVTRTDLSQRGRAHRASPHSRDQAKRKLRERTGFSRAGGRRSVATSTRTPWRSAAVCGGHHDRSEHQFPTTTTERRPLAANMGWVRTHQWAQVPRTQPDSVCGQRRARASRVAQTAEQRKRPPKWEHMLIVHQQPTREVQVPP